MRKIITLIMGLLLCSPLYSQNYILQNGDLIFQESCNSQFGDAIKGVTESAEQYNFTHVGIVWINKKDTFVIEATRPKVIVTPFYEYLYPKNECTPVSVVGRLKEQYQLLIPTAIKEALKLIGKEYDEEFNLENDKYYCSELIYYIFFKSNNGNPVFELNTMTFKDKNTDKFVPQWIKHFEKLEIEIPEGELGINPGVMSRSSVLDTLFVLQSINGNYR